MSRVEEIFHSMEYGPAPESDSVAQAWLQKHSRKFGHFIGNKWVLPDDRKSYDTSAPATGHFLASTVQGTKEDVDQAVCAANEAHSTWSKLSGHARSRHLYNLARQVQKHSRLIAVVEALDNGKSIRETRDADVLIVIRHLYYYAGWAELLDGQIGTNWSSVGVVGAIVPWNFPLMLLTWKVAPALAAGNTVILKPATYTRLSALLFAEICAEAGLPEGVFNVITGGGAMGQILAEHPNVDKVAFTGSTEVGKILRQATAGSGKKLSLELGGKSPVVVFESADLDSAIESVVDAIWFNQGHVCSAGSKLLVQESVYEKFISKLKLRMTTLRTGESLDKVIDLGAVVNEEQKKVIKDYVDTAIEEGAEVFQVDVPNNGCFYPPTLITKVNTASRVVEEEIFGPVLVALSFRTAKEAINLANNTIYGLAASVHTEQLTLALETAKSIKAGTVWVNCHNVFDAAAGFGGFKQSGFGRDGGMEGFLEYLKPAWQKNSIKIDNLQIDIKKFGGAYDADGPSLKADTQTGLPPIDRTYKLYYGGSQKRPDGMYSKTIRDSAGKEVAVVGQSNRKDVRNAVEAAVKGQTVWAKRSGFNRAQIIYYIAENLEIRKDEFAKKLTLVSSKSIDQSHAEVEKSIQRLFYWAAMCDKYGGSVQETQLYGTVIKLNEPVGVIGIVCPRSECPLLSFVSLLGAAICRSNSAIMIPDETNPLPALDLYQIFDTSDLPGGVVNILTGDNDHMAKYLAEHQEVDSVWYFGTQEGSKFVEYASASNVKRTWVNYGEKRDWFDDKQGQGEEFLYHSIEAKNVHLTMGDIFAN